MGHDDWRPSPGQVALLEPNGEPAIAPMTGFVQAGGPHPIIDVGAQIRLPDERCAVVASFFAADGLYRLEATVTAQPGGQGLVQLAVHNVDRIQRRAYERVQRTLPIELTTTNGTDRMVSGETLDVAPGGVRLATEHRLPAGSEPQVAITMPNGESVVALAKVLEAIEHAKGFEYRIAFSDLGDRDRDRLLDLTRGTD